ncbi:RHS repeat-associated core domain-containing protein [Kitasatospora sp. NPDC008050]|uniref:RHS repeat-associated core domain-containing protein n=1 Tax=Kitasatospora sp. NPDC008050 TaxID=3364021 RepID=UPI0036EA7EB8
MHYNVFRASDNQQVAGTFCLNGTTPFGSNEMTILNNPDGTGGLQAGVSYYAKIAVSHTNPGSASNNNGDWSCDTNWSSEVQTPAFAAYSNGQIVPAAETSGCGCADSSGRDVFQGHRGDPVNTLTLAEDEQATDISLSAPGVPFVLDRTYASDKPPIQNGILGAQWTFPYSAHVQDSSSSVQVTLEDGSVATYSRSSSGSLTPLDGVRSALAGNSTSGYTMTTPDKQVLTFGTGGQLQRWTDLNGTGLAFSYQGSATMPSSITDAAGHTVTLTFAPSSNLLTKVTLSDGRSVSYGYTSGLLTSLTGLDGGTTVYGYTAGGLLSSITDPAGHQVMSTTYANGLVASQTDANGRTLKFTGAADSSKYSSYSSYTDGNGGIWTDFYSGSQLYRSIDPLGKVTSYAYDANLHLSQVVDPQGNLTLMSYDPAGHLINRALPDGSSESWTYDNSGNETSHTTPGGAKTTWTYDSANHPISQTDPAGGTTTYAYTAKGQLASQTTPAARTTNYAYDNAGNLISITDAAGDRTTYTYDNAGRRSSVTDPRGNAQGANPASYTTTYTYDNADRLLSSTDATGAQTTFGYDAAGNRTSVTDPLGNRTTSTYDNARHLLTSTDPAGHQTIYTYDANGNQLTRTDPTGAKASSTYDADNHLLTTTSARGNATGANAAAYTTSYTYDGDGNTTSTTDPTGAVTRTTYDLLNRPATTVDALGNATTTTYGSDGNPLSTTDPTGARTTHTYDPNGRLTSTTDPLSHTTSYTYDGDGNRTSATTATGDTTRWTYGANGQLSSIIDPRGTVTGANASDYTTTFGYDQAGNRTTTTDALGHSTTVDYDALNRITSTTNALGNSTTRGYDPDGNLTKVTDPNNATTTYTFDSAGNPTSRADGNGHLTGYTYDADNRLITTTDPLARKTTYAYDADGNQTSRTDARGTTATNTYDARDQATGTTYSDGTPAVSVTNDAVGRTTAISDGTGSHTLTYDNAGRLLTESVPGTATGFTYTYDAAGHVTSRQYPDGRSTTATYDADGRPITATTAGATTTYAYDAADHLTSTTLPATNGYTEQRTYDHAGQLTTIASSNSTNTLSSFTLSYDAAGQPLTLTPVRVGLTNGPSSYTYDPAGRLTNQCTAPSGSTGCPTGSASTAWTYDQAGNRLTQSRGGRTTTYTYDADDELTNAATGLIRQTYTYDADGNYTGDGSTANTIAYDANNHPISAVQAGVSYTFSNDAQGDRVTTTAGGKLARTAYWDINNTLPQLATETDASGALISDYTYDPLGNPQSQLTNSGTLYDHHDWLGSVTDLTDSTGTPQLRTSYDAFGQANTTNTTTSAPNNPFGYTGQYNDPYLIGQQDVHARNYAPALGRFTTRDPIQLRPDSPYSSDYAYADNAPTYITDPSGQCSFKAKIYDAFHAILAGLGQGHCKAEDDAAAQKTPLAAAAGAHIEQFTEGLINAPGQFTEGFLDTQTFGLAPSLVPGAQTCPKALAYQAGSLAAMLTPWGEDDAAALTVDQIRARYKERGATPKTSLPRVPLQPIHLALGRDNIDGYMALDMFALENGAVTFKSSLFNDVVPRGVATEDGLSKMIDRVVDSGGQISFNLAGMSDLVDVLAGKNFGSGWTSHELRYVCGKPEARAITTFVNGTAPC